MTTTHVGTVHLHDDGHHGYVRVETCPINVDLLALKLPPQRCLMHVGQTPEDSPEMRVCRFLDLDGLGPRDGDTIPIRCCWPTSWACRAAAEGA